MHSHSVKLLSLIVFVVVTQLGASDANPQWNKDPNDPYGIGKPTNTDGWDGKSTFGGTSTDPFGKNFGNDKFDFGKTNDDFGSFGSDFETRSREMNRDFETKSREFDREFERNRKTAQNIFWIVASIIIVTFIVIIIGVIACICVPTCYLARYRHRRSEGRVYHQPNATPGAVPMTGYPTQPVTSGAPPSYPYPSQPQGQYPYPSQPQGQYPYPPQQQPMPMTVYPNQIAPYPTAPAPMGNATPYNPNYGSGPGANQTKSPYPDLPYPTN